LSDRIENNAMPSAYDEDWGREKPQQFGDPGRKLLKGIDCNCFSGFSAQHSWKQIVQA